MSFSNFLTDSITLVQYGTRDTWGEEDSTPTSTTIKARVQFHTEMIIGAKGEEIQIQGKVWIENQTIDQNDQLTIDGTDYSIVPIQEAVGKRGSVHHLTLGII